MDLSPLSESPATPFTIAATKKRRNRRPKACLPCRNRKVRCDYTEPCTTCRRRKHVHLCIYEENPRLGGIHTTHNRLSTVTTSARTITSRPTTSSSLPVDGSGTDIPSLLSNVTTNLSPVISHDTQTGETIYLGRNSSAAFFSSLLSSSPDPITLPSEISIPSAFGLTNRTPLHPFGSLWAATASVTLGDILRSLPGTDRCMRYYRAYNHIGQPFLPYLLDPGEFERRLCEVIQLIEAVPGDHEGAAAGGLPYSELAWYGLLFSVLAAGCQFADEDVSSEKKLTTRVFVACSFECLRLANFYVQPSLETIQTTLFLEYVIANDCNPGVGWAFLANTARHAEGMGLHLAVSAERLGEMHAMYKGVVHMDSMHAFVFDRRPLAFLPRKYDVVKELMASKLEFRDFLHALSCIRLEWQTSWLAQSEETWNAEEPRRFLVKAEQVDLLSRSEGSSLQATRSMQARLERLIFDMHFAHTKAEFSRFGCLATDATAEEQRKWYQTMKTNLAMVVETFLTLKPLTPFAHVSWDTMYCTISAALVLAADHAVTRDLTYASLLGSLTKSLKSIAETHHSDDENESLPAFWHGLQYLETLLHRYVPEKPRPALHPPEEYTGHNMIG
ncbi:putative transcriptional regulatory protein C3H8.08c [Pseudocercospora fuligena]|uniref:Putative transcriptional regulatory protein C3H8.08c n=1 Tax=Pseudocercospora fuligena TaxID=685502 RepID=A0A8H6VET4_9PEZI|nr:putative transcriptional regulatory protein C3H8.08c [Pseudocercospora fuligena]